MSGRVAQVVSEAVTWGTRFGCERHFVRSQPTGASIIVSPRSKGPGPPARFFLRSWIWSVMAFGPLVLGAVAFLLPGAAKCNCAQLRATFCFRVLPAGVVDVRRRGLGFSTNQLPVLLSASHCQGFRSSGGSHSGPAGHRTGKQILPVLKSFPLPTLTKAGTPIPSQACPWHPC